MQLSNDVKYICFQGRGFRYMEINPVDVVVKTKKHYNALPEDWEMYMLCNETAGNIALSFHALQFDAKVSS